MDFTIRSARADDAADLSELIRGLGFFQRLAHEGPDETAKRVTAHVGMSLADDSHALFVAVDSAGGLLGYAAVHWLPYLFLAGPEGFLSELFVAASARDNGVGTALLEAAVDAARERGCARMMLEAVRTRESYTRGFYTKRGWTERPDMANMVLEL